MSKKLTHWHDIARDFPSLFQDSFLSKWENHLWEPSELDKKAAAELHVQLISRISTQNLGYLDGVEVSALTSIYQIFGHARDIAGRYALARHFDCIVWHILNSHVRPFTAKWHKKSTEGALDALDETDEFRTELLQVQKTLISFDLLLLFLRDEEHSPVVAAQLQTTGMEKEMQQVLKWGIPSEHNGIPVKIVAEINATERAIINKRRANYNIENLEHASGLAISGGGIRSATFALGVLVALSKRNLLPQFDYMSTVSGGGYVGSFITTYLAGDAPDLGLGRNQDPFQHEGGEGSALRHIRHQSRYLHTSIRERFTLATAQVYGMLVNASALMLIPLAVAVIEFFLRNSLAAIGLPVNSWYPLLALFVIALTIPAFSRLNENIREHADTILAWAAGICFFLFLWNLLGIAHSTLRFFKENIEDSATLGLIFFTCTGIAAILFASTLSLTNRRFKLLQMALAVVAGLAAPLFFIVVEFVAYEWISGGGPKIPMILIEFSGVRAIELLFFIFLIFFTIWVPLDINFTSPHRHYKRKLSEAFLIQRVKTSQSGFEMKQVKLSEGIKSGRSPYHLINAALNVPNTKNRQMQGRLTDFFLFSPAYCGSPLVGYSPTNEWESADSRLDIATAMAISGAAASPIMGLTTYPHLTFWLAILNIRLGYWLRKPTKTAGSSKTPGVNFLCREMLGQVDELGTFLNVTDGGHIENLGVYELLRRRCKFIMAIDGEFDPSMTFYSLTTLQRLAAIDLGIDIDIKLDDLRLRPNGLSRSHFQICRINYPKIGDLPAGIGYLIYAKLSLTGNEGEFIRRYRADEPEFPHHSTSNQFFTEAQFEAYRSLGEHIGEKLFLDAIVGDLSENPSISAWFCAIGHRMLNLKN